MEVINIDLLHIRRVRVYRNVLNIIVLQEYSSITINKNKVSLEGLVTAVGEDRWCLNCALQSRTLGKTHVTKFWQVYADTMRPIRKRVNKNVSIITTFSDQLTICAYLVR
jgi:hypothetical protein